MKIQRISNLLNAEVAAKDTVRIVKCSESLIFKLKKLKKDGQSQARSPSSGGHNKKRMAEFLEAVTKEIEENTTLNMKEIIKKLEGSPWTAHCQ
ncbi:Uncharacterized protein FKW44_019877 [Caligus rogercresseyi]|uniref:Uncharacterized protein n=1 Tax=Caligus rogercresseyi TaxID=217165 RepID=A0A7T8GWG1_CALRO|nr:Uncharacterized protein FKW44_019877 [Caligus rogercresseyi]